MSIANQVSDQHPNSSATDIQQGSLQETKETESDELSIPPTVTQETLLNAINSKILPPERVLDELLFIRRIHDLLSLSESTKTQFLWNAFLQVMGIIFVIVFGVFSVLAYSTNERANKLTADANQLALLSLCINNNSVGPSVCQ